MDIIVDARALNGKHNGLSRYSHGIITALQKLDGVNLLLISNKPIKFPKSENVTIVEDLKWQHVPGTVWLQLRLPFIISQINYNVFLGLLHQLPLIRSDKLKYSVVIHDLVYLLFPETMTFWNRLLSKILIPQSIETSDIIFSVSRQTKMDISKYYPKASHKVEIIYPGKDDSTLITKKRVSENKIRLLFVGSIEPRKNLTGLVIHFLEAKLNGFSGTLDIVSGEKWGTVITSDLRHHPCYSSVKFHYGISDQDLNQLYCEADYLVFPSLYEGFGLPILEAVDRCKIVANDIPIFRELSRYISNIEFCDFSAHNTSATRSNTQNKLIALQKKKAVSQFKSTEARDMFSWNNSAKLLLLHLGKL